MFKFRIPSIMVAMVGLAAACSDGGTPTRTLVITGSSTMAPLIGEMAKRFEAAHAGIRVDVQTGGSSRGVADVRSCLAQVGMVSRDLRSDEDDLLATPVATDTVTLIVHRDNPIDALSREQVIGIFRGEIKTWTSLSGLDHPITVVHKAEGRSTLELFLSHFGLKNSSVKAHVIVGDNEQGIKSVAGVPGAIGYVSLGTAVLSLQGGVSIRIVRLLGESEPSADGESKRSAIRRNLNLVCGKSPEALTQSFLTFASSQAVRDLILAEAFIPLEK
ncbi:MAG TPA: phosphate ABC transporter substrate-binding protein [Planctomycetota bacterium]|jgi:phosphate transport system substrate-binding protein|nr:phosphate ABC transporter substrate-binding protein [Planctomycetota bacterium]